MSSAQTIILGISSFVFLLVSTLFEPTQSIVALIHLVGLLGYKQQFVQPPLIFSNKWCQFVEESQLG